MSGTTHDLARPSLARGRQISVLHLLERFGLVWLLVLVVCVFAFYSKTSGVFTSAANIRNIVANESVIGLAALAALIPLVTMRFDVSVGAVLGGTVVLVAYLTVDSGLPLAVALVIGVLAGAAVGALNGFVIAFLGPNSFIVTIGVATAVGGLVSLLSRDQTIVGVPQQLLDFGNQYWLGVPRPTWLLAVVALLVAYLLRYTVFGRQLLQIGSNPRSARLVGIPVRRLVFSAFVLAGILAAVAGALQLARTGSGNPGNTVNFTLNALAACFLGATSFRPGQFNVPGTIVGVFFVAITVNGLTLAGANDWVEPLFNGSAVVIAVTLSTVLGRRRGRPAAAL